MDITARILDTRLSYFAGKENCFRNTSYSRLELLNRLSDMYQYSVEFSKTDIHNFQFRISKAPKMQQWSLVGHPILDEIKSADIVQGEYDLLYLFLPPPYARASRPALDYLFLSTPEDTVHLHCHKDSKIVVNLQTDTVASEAGFSDSFVCHVLHRSFCSTASLRFIMYEVDNDLYQLRPVPPICSEIVRCSQSAAEAQRFLEEGLQNAVLKEYIGEVSHHLFTSEINAKNRNECIEYMRDSMSNIADIVFAEKITEYWPIGVKLAMNTLIFNAISAKEHFRLLMAFHEAMEEENKIAQQAARYVENDGQLQMDTEELEKALIHLRNILHAKSPMDAITSLVAFFEGVIKALPTKEVAADDILPCICQAMTRDVGLGSHVVSFFTYLTEIWPPVGMNERISYILVTCAIAVQHLERSGAKQNAEPQPKKETPAMQQTIGMLEDLLNCFEGPK